MRVLQLIDSLHPGGAERMAVTLANSLAEKIEGSYICASREEGLLKGAIDSRVKYLFLQKKSTLDIAAIKRLKGFIELHNIDVIHAHSSSFFYGWMIKRLKPSIRLIWHDHYGNSEHLNNRNFRILRFCSSKFSGIIAVNSLLADWSKENLHCETVVFIKNFVTENKQSKSSEIDLSGIAGKRILCVANLRPQKDHQNLLMAFEIIKKNHPDASLHIIGKNDNEYGYDLIKKIETSHSNNIYYYGALTLSPSIYNQANLGVLSSLSEGLPVSLLEYGLHGLPIVVTDVGACKKVVSTYGKVVPAQNSEAFARACIDYFDNYDKAKQDATKFKNHILTNYSFNSIFEILLQLYKV